MVVGKTDAFEREYMEKFRQFASKYGEFISYERDRGARDIGLHFTKPLESGNERLTSSLCWFQMKGIMSETLTSLEYDSLTKVKISLDVVHLKHWFLQPNPTYLVVYVESKDIFLIINIQQYIQDNWGKDIILDTQKTRTIEIEKKDILDEDAFNIIIKDGDFEEWKKALDKDDDTIYMCLRDYKLIWKIQAALNRESEIRLEYWNWQSKTRGQLYIREFRDGKEKLLREHWQYLHSIQDLEESYPYIEFYKLENEDDDEYSEDYDFHPEWLLANGEVIQGSDCSGEYYLYEAGIRLNEYGLQLFSYIEVLKLAGIIEIDEQSEEVISIAPWHARNL